MGPLPSSRLSPIDPRVARQWRAWATGPDELRLRCLGGPVARVIAAAHQHWPLARGQTRLHGLIGRLPAVRDVRFCSTSGVEVHLDMGAYQFLHLSGRLPTEPLELAIIMRLVRSGDVFVDVGAHLGLYVLHVLGRLGATGRYHALEPSPSNMARMRRAFRGASGLVLHPAAAGDVSGRAVLVSEDSLVARLAESEYERGTSVPIVRLDELLEHEGNASHWVMKLDVEGHEDAVLRGCSRLLDAGLRPTVMLEVLPTLSGDKRRSLMAALQKWFAARYRWYAICQTHGTVHRFPQEGSSHVVLNALLIPDEQRERLEGAFVAGALQCAPRS